MINAREYLADLALMAEGLSAAPDKLEDLLDLIATCPADRASRVACLAIAGQSICARTVCGVWFRANVRHPILLAPYVTGMAVANVITIARDADALRSGDYDFDRADVLIIGEGNNLHALTVLRRTGNVVESSDGGQREGIFEAIEDRTRLEVDTAGARFLGGRRIQHVIDADAIAARWGIGDDEPDTQRSAT